MRYHGWNFERTILAEAVLSSARKQEIIDVRIVIPTRDAGNLSNDVRAVIKPEWNTYGAEVPCQIYGVERTGESTAFRMLFKADLAPGLQNRFGIVYDHPSIGAPSYDAYLKATNWGGSPLGWTIDNRHYRIDCDPASGQPKKLQLKLFFKEWMSPKEITPAEQIQGGAGVIFASVRDGKPTSEEVTAANVQDFTVTAVETGPICCAITRRGTLRPPAESLALGAPPQIQIKTIYLDEKPYFIVEQTIHFPEATPVYGIWLDGVTVRAERFSHYSFRPVSPSLAAGDVEEMGHVIVDPKQLEGVPAGDMMGDFLPPTLAWQSFINIYKGPFANQYAFTSIDFGASHSGPRETAAIEYRSACHLERDPARGTARFFRAPVWVRNRALAATMVTIPAGTTYRQRMAYCSSEWNTHEFAGEIEALGRRLNTPPKLSVHPVYLGSPFASQGSALPLFGRRADAYLRGVR